MNDFALIDIDIQLSGLLHHEPKALLCSPNFLNVLRLAFDFLGLLRRWLLASFDWQISLLALKVSSFFLSVLLFVFFGELLNFTSTGGDFLPPSFQSSALHLDMIMHTD